jgi:hypothetical protein
MRFQFLKIAGTWTLISVPLKAFPIRAAFFAIVITAAHAQGNQLAAGGVGKPPMQILSGIQIVATPHDFGATCDISGVGYCQVWSSRPIAPGVQCYCGAPGYRNGTVR